MPTIFVIPYRWFTNVADLLEKRPFHPAAVFSFCCFVGIGRICLEWLGGRTPTTPWADIVGFVVFYWFGFFSYGLLLGLLVPGAWRRRINVILIGLFCGLIPPFIDLAIYGIGNFRYTYLWDFPATWSWALYNPEHRVPMGEAIVLWSTIAFTSLYVHYRTQSIMRGAAAALGAYAVVAWIGGGVAWLAQRMAAAVEVHGPNSRLHFLLALELFFSATVYLAMQPRLAGHLARRMLHAIPLTGLFFCGSAFAGKILPVSYWVATILTFLAAATLVQNDHYDRADDEAQHRPPYADGSDAAFFTIVGALLLMTLAIGHSVLLLPLGLYYVTSILYNFPFYRGKKHFPANIKMEGVAAAAAFLAGLMTAWEHGAAGINMFNFQTSFWTKANHMAGIVPETVWAVCLVFGGWSLLATLKDFKDVAADSAGGVQTVYTLALRRGYDIRVLQRKITAISVFCLALPMPLLIAIGKLPAMWLWPAAVFAAAFYGILRRYEDAAGFRLFLALLSAFFFAIAAGLHFHAQ